MNLKWEENKVFTDLSITDLVKILLPKDDRNCVLFILTRISWMLCMLAKWEIFFTNISITEFW